MTHGWRRRGERGLADSRGGVGRGRQRHEFDALDVDVRRWVTVGGWDRRGLRTERVDGDRLLVGFGYVHSFGRGYLGEWECGVAILVPAAPALAAAPGNTTRGPVKALALGTGAIGFSLGLRTGRRDGCGFCRARKDTNVAE